MKREEVKSEEIITTSCVKKILLEIKEKDKNRKILRKFLFSFISKIFSDIKILKRLKQEGIQVNITKERELEDQIRNSLDEVKNKLDSEFNCFKKAPTSEVLNKKFSAETREKVKLALQDWRDEKKQKDEQIKAKTLKKMRFERLKEARSRQEKRRIFLDLKEKQSHLNEKEDVSSDKENFQQEQNKAIMAINLKRFHEKDKLIMQDRKIQCNRIKKPSKQKLVERIKINSLAFTKEKFRDPNRIFSLNNSSRVRELETKLVKKNFEVAKNHSSRDYSSRIMNALPNNMLVPKTFSIALHRVSGKRQIKN